MDGYGVAEDGYYEAIEEKDTFYERSVIKRTSLPSGEPFPAEAAAAANQGGIIKGTLFASGERSQVDNAEWPLSINCVLTTGKSTMADIIEATTGDCFGKGNAVE